MNRRRDIGSGGVHVDSEHRAVDGRRVGGKGAHNGCASDLVGLLFGGDEGPREIL